MGYKEVNGEPVVDCPLMGPDTNLGLCVDISEAAFGYLKKSAVPEVEDWEKARKTCEKCRYFSADDE